MKKTLMTLVGFRIGLAGSHPSQCSVPVRAMQTCVFPLPSRLFELPRRRSFL